jgi:hypothetical protein
MNFLPQNTELGALKMVQVYEYYDKPLLFACQNEFGHLFLGLYDGEEGTQEQWLYLPISAQRHLSIHMGVIDLRSAFLRAEGGYVYWVVVPLGQDATSTRVAVSDLDPEYLPDAGEALNYSAETLHNPRPQ